MRPSGSMLMLTRATGYSAAKNIHLDSRKPYICSGSRKQNVRIFAVHPVQRPERQWTSAFVFWAVGKACLRGKKSGVHRVKPNTAHLLSFDVDPLDLLAACFVNSDIPQLQGWFGKVQASAYLESDRTCTAFL